MKTRIMVFVAAALVLAAGPAFAQKKEDKDAILGTWTFVSGERNGEAPPDEVKSMKLTFMEDKVAMAVKDDNKEAKYKIDATKKPKEMTLSMTENGTTRDIRGIYDLDGDTLKVCFPADPTGETPKEFTGKKDSKQMYMVFKRAK